MSGWRGRIEGDRLWLCTFDVDQCDRFVGYLETRSRANGSMRLRAPFPWYRRLLGNRAWLATMLGRSAVRADATFYLIAPRAHVQDDSAGTLTAHSVIGALDAVLALRAERLGLSLQSPGFAMVVTGQPRETRQHLRDYATIINSALEPHSPKRGIGSARSRLC